MTKYSPANERIKREYFAYLREAKGRDEATIDGVAKASRGSRKLPGAATSNAFKSAQALAFKAALAKALNARTGERISKATMLSTLRELRAFFFWLAREPGFKSHLAYSDAEYFNLSDKDITVARAKREKRVPTLAQVHHVLSEMPADTVLERRDRALVAFTALTAARAGALASFQLCHVDLSAESRSCRTRERAHEVSKDFLLLGFVPVGGDARPCLRLGAII